MTTLLDVPDEPTFDPHVGETHQSISLGTGVYTPYIPNGAKCILLQAVTQNIRYTLDGTTPTATVGFQMAAAAAPIRVELTAHTVLKFFREASGAVLQYCIGG